MKSEDLVERLARNLAPVRRLPSPGALMARWLLVTLPVLAAVTLMMKLRPDLAVLLVQPRFMLTEGLAAATMLSSAYAAFCAGRPDQPVWKLFMPMAGFLLWLTELGRQCFVLSVQTDGAALVLHADWQCVPAIAMTALVPAAAMVWLLRRSAKFRPTHSCLCGTLAAAAAAEFVLPLFHAADTMMTVLVWQMGSVALFTLLGALTARLGLNTLG
ncbi:NrsF family protein [Acidocella facilis]|uniref:NrsF family protein n=1 Tax=Acidocella facilis TaxID=525 RepID=UPI0004794C77|nr:NrsF family protein [Acidocella facilis]